MEMLSRVKLKSKHHERLGSCDGAFPSFFTDMNPNWSFASASHQHIVKLADDSVWRSSFLHTHYRSLSLPLTRTHTHNTQNSFVPVHSGTPAQRSSQPLPVPVHLLQCKSLMMCCPGNGWRWVAPRAVGGSQPLSSVGGICWAQPSPWFWKGAGSRLLLRRCGCWWIITSPPCSFVRDRLVCLLFLRFFVFCFCCRMWKLQLLTGEFCTKTKL